MDDGHNHFLADKRLIEHGFPCHQVGAETQRERGASSALPPLYFLHVWWARRPLTPSRAAIVASLAPWDTDPEQFVRQLGIERLQALVNDQPWTLTGDLLGMVDQDAGGGEFLEVNAKVVKALQDEQEHRAENRQLIAQMQAKNPALAKDPVLQRWAAESQSLPTPFPDLGEWLPVRRVMGDPAWAKERIDWENAHKIRTAEDKYGYERAFKLAPCYPPSELTVLDPTAGGGSIPFEALRLGYKVIANELNPVATTILYATLDYPIRFGVDLANDIRFWGSQLRAGMVEQMGDLFPVSRIPGSELAKLRSHLTKAPELVAQYEQETLDGFIYARQVTCPHCHGEAPLLNTMWLSKEVGDPWGVRVITDGKPKNGTVRFETYRLHQGKGPNGENPDEATVNRGTGQCSHCKQAIDGDEIKSQARGESEHGA